jgi:hypothetical protein
VGVDSSEIGDQQGLHDPSKSNQLLTAAKSHSTSHHTTQLGFLLFIAFCLSGIKRYRFMQRFLIHKNSWLLFLRNMQAFGNTIEL